MKFIKQFSQKYKSIGVGLLIGIAFHIIVVAETGFSLAYMFEQNVDLSTLVYQE